MSYSILASEDPKKSEKKKSSTKIKMEESKKDTQEKLIPVKQAEIKKDVKEGSFKIKEIEFRKINGDVYPLFTSILDTDFHKDTIFFTRIQSQGTNNYYVPRISFLYPVHYFEKLMELIILGTLKINDRTEMEAMQKIVAKQAGKNSYWLQMSDLLKATILIHPERIIDFTQFPISLSLPTVYLYKPEKNLKSYLQFLQNIFKDYSFCTVGITTVPTKGDLSYVPHVLIYRDKYRLKYEFGHASTSITYLYEKESVIKCQLKCKCNILNTADYCRECFEKIPINIDNDTQSYTEEIIKIAKNNIITDKVKWDISAIIFVYGLNQ